MMWGWYRLSGELGLQLYIPRHLDWLQTKWQTAQIWVDYQNQPAAHSIMKYKWFAAMNAKPRAVRRKRFLRPPKEYKRSSSTLPVDGANLYMLHFFAVYALLIKDDE